MQSLVLQACLDDVVKDLSNHAPAKPTTTNVAASIRSTRVSPAELADGGLKAASDWAGTAG